MVNAYPSVNIIADQFFSLFLLDSFSVDNVTGVISTNVLLDREQHSHFTLNVRAKDGDVSPRYNTTVVYIVVLDENDNDPTFTKSRETVHVFEGLPLGFSVANVSQRGLSLIPTL